METADYAKITAAYGVSDHGLPETLATLRYTLSGAAFDAWQRERDRWSTPTALRLSEGDLAGDACRLMSLDKMASDLMDQARRDVHALEATLRHRVPQLAEARPAPPSDGTEREPARIEFDRLTAARRM